MINLNTNKTLNIILPNTNKALKEVLQSATHKELETLSSSKDLKSIVNDILKQSSKESSQDKMLLNLVKNNPTLKGLGSITTSLKELLNTLKQDKNPLPLEKILKSFLSDINDISERTLKTKIENSGIFLENKLKTIQTPKQELKELLNELLKQTSSSKLPSIKTLNSQIKELLSSEILKNATPTEILANTKADFSSLTALSKNVVKLLENFSQRINSSVDKSIAPNDTIFSKETKHILEKVQLLSKPEQLQTQVPLKEMLSHDLKAILLKTHEEIQSSNHPNRQELLKHIDKLSLVIDYQQLVSHLSNATSLYIPYSWDALEDGNITLKNTKDGKFFTDIELQLKEYGELQLRLGLFDKNQLNVNITTQSKELKTILQENISTLKKQLFAAGLTPMSIRFLDEDSTLRSAYTENSEQFNSGFEVKA